MGKKRPMENIPAQSETSHDVSHTCWRMSVILNSKGQHTHTHARTKTDNLLSDEHNCYCATQWLPEKMYVCYLVLELVCEVRTCVFKKWLPFNTLETDSSKPGLYQESHDHPKQLLGNAIQWLWSALLIKSNVCLRVCTVAAAAVCPEGRRQTRLGRWNSDHAQIQIGSRQKKEKHSVCVTTFITSFISMYKTMPG